MVKIWKVIGIVASVLVIGVLVFCGIWTVRNWNTVYSSFDGTSFYTYEDMQKLKQDTIEESAKNEVSYKEQINNLREQIVNLQDKNQSLEKEKTDLIESNNVYKDFIDNYYVNGISIVNYEVDGLSIDVIPVITGVMLNEVLTTKNVPEKENYSFIGWSLDGQSVIDPLNYIVEENITLKAVYELKVYNVSFVVNEQVVATQSVRHGDCANDIEVETKGNFKGWLINGTLINLSNYQITSDTTFIAQISFIINSSQEKILGGVGNVDYYDGENVWTCGDKIYYSLGNEQYVFDVESQIWVPMDWNGENVAGKYVWTDGVNYYCSGTTYNYYILDVATNTWSPITFNYDEKATFTGSGVWSDGVNTYWSNVNKHYVFDGKTNTWTKITWNGKTSFTGMAVWSDGVNTYLSFGENHYILESETRTWVPITWTGLTSFSGDDIWTDGENIYWSGYVNSTYCHYVLDKTTNSWLLIDWIYIGDYNKFEGKHVWTDGNTCYYSDSNIQYEFKYQVGA